MTVQTSIFALGRSPRYWHEPLSFRPQQWLPSSYSQYDAAFGSDLCKGLSPFGLGLRACLGREMAWAEGRMFMAKVLWSFDVLKVPGQMDMDGPQKNLLHYGFLVKPEVRVQFMPVQRGRD
jgi:cytochrome P450